MIDTVKRILVPLGWLALTVLLYIILVTLEFYWNVPDWQPKADRISILLLLLATGTIAGIGFVCRVSGRRTLVFGAVCCSLLLALGIYIIAPEPVRPGFLGRERASAWWYRWGRLSLLASPTVLFSLRCLQTKTTPPPIEEPSSR